MLFMGILHGFNKIIEKELRVHRTAGRLRVELGREERLGTVANSLVRPVIHVHKKRFPVGRQGPLVYRETVILGSDIATGATRLHHRLVMPAMPVFQFIGFRPGSPHV